MSLVERLSSFRAILPLLIVAIIVLGGIYSGIFTPTESAAAGVTSTIVLLLMLRQLKSKILRESLIEAVSITAMIMMIVVGASILGIAMNRLGAGTLLLDFFEGLNISPLGTILIISIVYIILGCILEPLSTLLLTLPLIYPIVQAAGYDLVWFGVILVILVEMALITPPVGLNVYIVQGIMGGEYRSGMLARAILPFFLCQLAVLALLIAFPEIVLWLPNKMVS